MATKRLPRLELPISLDASGTIAERIFRRPRTGNSLLLGYVLPEVHESEKGWYLDYYVQDRWTGKLIRYKHKLNRVANIHQRRKWARDMVLLITAKLETGWRPWQEVPPKRMTLGLALSKWEELKCEKLRHSSPYSYHSLKSVLRAWMRSRGLLNRSVDDIKREDIARFLGYLLEKRRVATRTYNNYLVFLGMLFRWMLNHGLINATPVVNFHKQRAAQKSRVYLSDEERARLVPWIENNDPDFLLPCLFVYGTLIRPGELRRLRVHHVDLQNRVVRLPAELTKNGRARDSAIPDWMYPFVEHSLKGVAQSHWLVSKQLKPGPTQIARNTLGRHWVKARRALDWNHRHQLYSLRDTGIIQLVRDGVETLHIQQQAGHTDMAVTNSYLQHAFPKGPLEVRTKATPLLVITKGD